jgi:hypothetical protein
LRAGPQRARPAGDGDESRPASEQPDVASVHVDATDPLLQVRHRAATHRLDLDNFSDEDVVG